MVSASRLMSVGPRYGRTAQLGVVGRLCWGGGNRWPARPEVDVEVVLACAPQGNGPQGRGTGDRAGALSGRDAAGTAAPRHPRGTSGDANLQEEASGGGVGLNLVAGGHTVMSRGSIPRGRRAWATCARISRLGPSRAALLCLQEDRGLPHPRHRGEKAREDGRSGRRSERSPPASPASVPGCPAPPV